MKKNILIIYTDQLKRDVLGCYGGNEVSTPNIDALKEDGVILDNFYTPSAVCTPSRGCLMTGRYPHRNGAYRNGVPVNREEHGFAEVFEQAGYHTGYLGKWHLADHKEMGEKLGEYNSLGFCEWEDKVEFGHCKSIFRDNGEAIPSKNMGDDKSYTTDWLANETIRFLKSRIGKEEPFLFMVSIPDPHQPFAVRHPYDTMFDPLKLQIPESFYQKEIPDWAERDTWGRMHHFPRGMFEREGHFRRAKAQYLGEVKCIDDNVGKITAYLKNSGLWENTIVIFTTDHGEYLGEHGLMEKNNLYENVYHIPMVMTLPGMSVKSRNCKTWLNVIDFGRTLAGLVDIPYRYETDGLDRSRQILDNETSLEELYIHPSDVPRAGILTPDYELAYVGMGHCGEKFHEHVLFDCKKDPLQVNNLFNNPDYRKIQEELTEKIRVHHRMMKTPKKFLPEEVW